MKFKKFSLVSLISIIILNCFIVKSKAENKSLEYIVGKDRIETSVLLSNYVDSKVLVLVNAYNFADALSSYNIVSRQKSKLILVTDKTDISELLRNKGIEKVYLIGGENVLKGRPVEDAKKIVGKVIRLSGKNRYDTNRQTLKESGYTEVGVADGRNFPDALSASGLLKQKNLGLMLVDGSKSYITDYNVRYTFGGKESIIQEGGKRLWDVNRYATSEVINNELKIAKNTVFVSGKVFADALSSLNLINLSGGVSVSLSEGRIGSNELQPFRNYYKTNNKTSGEILVIGGVFKYGILNEEFKAIIANLNEEIELDDKLAEISKKIKMIKSKIEEKFKVYNSDKFIKESEKEELYKEILELDLESANLKREYALIEIKKNPEKKAFYKREGILDTSDYISRLEKQKAKLAKVKEKEISIKDIIGNHKYFTKYTLDKYLYIKLINGISDNEEPIYLENNLYGEYFGSPGFKRVFEGMGFKCSGKILSETKELSLVRPFVTTHDIYSGNYYRENYIIQMDEVDKLIKMSGVKQYKDKSRQAIEFAKFLIVCNHNSLMKTYDIDTTPTPLIKSVGNNNEAKNLDQYEIKWIYNQAMFRLGIPSYSIKSDVFSKDYIRVKLEHMYSVLDMTSEKISRFKYNEKIDIKNIEDKDILIPEDSNKVPNGLSKSDREVDDFYENIK
mgnify:CR=1 FL=1